MAMPGRSQEMWMKLAGDTIGSLKKYVHGIVSETRDFDTLSIEKEIGSNSRFFF